MYRDPVASEVKGGPVHCPVSRVERIMAMAPTARITITHSLRSMAIYRFSSIWIRLSICSGPLLGGVSWLLNLSPEDRGHLRST